MSIILSMNDKYKSWLLVSVQAILLVLLIFFTDSGPSSYKYIGEIIKISGAIILLFSFWDLRRSLTALPTPVENGVLQIHGLYRYVRHPMYVGVLTLSLGICVANTSVMKYVLLAALYVLFSYKSRFEEQLLLAKYPGYKKYMSRTNRFIPKVSQM